MNQAAESPHTLRIIHHLACSGGTIMTHALAAQPGVVALSELHPAMGMRRRVNPFKQVEAAYPGLISSQDLDRVFTYEVAFLAERCRERSRTLVLRDHASADFLNGDDFTSLRTADVLADTFSLRRLFTVRHPIDTWLGLQAQGWIKFDIAEFCRRFARFAEFAATCRDDQHNPTGFVRYEDFTTAPDPSTRDMCERLDIGFDVEWQSRMADVGQHLTGRSGRSKAEERGPEQPSTPAASQPSATALDIAPRPRRPIDPADAAAFEASPDYHAALTTLGYAHPVGLAA